MNNKLVLQNNNTKLENVLDIANKLPNKEDIYGQYIWKKYELDQTTFIGYVTSNNENAYPDKGTYKNYYYEKYSTQTTHAVAVIFSVVTTTSTGADYLIRNKIILYSDYTYSALYLPKNWEYVEYITIDNDFLPYNTKILINNSFSVTLGYVSNNYVNFPSLPESGTWEITQMGSNVG